MKSEKRSMGGRVIFYERYFLLSIIAAYESTFGLALLGQRDLPSPSGVYTRCSAINLKLYADVLSYKQ